MPIALNDDDALKDSIMAKLGMPTTHRTEPPMHMLGDSFAARLQRQERNARTAEQAAAAAAEHAQQLAHIDAAIAEQAAKTTRPTVTPLAASRGQRNDLKTAICTAIKEIK